MDGESEREKKGGGGVFDQDNLSTSNIKDWNMMTCNSTLNRHDWLWGVIDGRDHQLTIYVGSAFTSVIVIAREREREKGV